MPPHSIDDLVKAELSWNRAPNRNIFRFQQQSVLREEGWVWATSTRPPFLRQAPHPSTSVRSTYRSIPQHSLSPPPHSRSTSLHTVPSRVQTLTRPALHTVAIAVVRERDTIVWSSPSGCARRCSARPIGAYHRSCASEQSRLRLHTRRYYHQEQVSGTTTRDACVGVRRS